MAGEGYGPGQGPGYGRGNGPGYGRGMGQGPGGGTPLLTQEERTQFREKMHSFKTVDECNAYLAEHRKLITERAKEKGLPEPTTPRGNPCERMKARGMLG
jgi:hypothetical protein